MVAPPKATNLEIKRHSSKLPRKAIEKQKRRKSEATKLRRTNLKAIREMPYLNGERGRRVWWTPVGLTEREGGEFDSGEEMGEEMWEVNDVLLSARLEYFIYLFNVGPTVG